MDWLKSTIGNFWSKVNKTDSCWEWTAFLDRDGYGGFTINYIDTSSKYERAHRFSWILANGEIQSGQYILHKCDNRKCVNPSHLFVGTAKDNYEDSVRKGRNALPPPAPRKVFPEHEARIVELCKQGVKHSEIAKEIGVVREIVSKYARKHGFTKNFNQEEILEMKRMHDSGMNYRQIAEVFDREQSSIRKAIARL